ncbi:MAG TPA: hypothetical protein EYH30_02720 [Anaerolineales bacterium]|nr:hypothetical protein [Anaerolineae bacterium]HIQ01035.1 hypothetical protein [Anaerolineales bacterium]
MRKGTVLLALILILAGVYFLLVELDLGVPSLDRLWPLFPFAGGVAALGNYLRTGRQEHGSVFWGTALVLTGLFFFLISLGDQDYTVLQTWWPVFIVIAGISFLALWLAQGLRDWGALFLSIVALLFGGVALAVNLQILGPNTAQELRRLWPALLVLVGLVLLMRGLLGRRPSRQ